MIRRLKYWWLFLRIWRWRPPQGISHNLSVSPQAPDVIAVYLSLLGDDEHLTVTPLAIPIDRSTALVLGEMDHQALELLRCREFEFKLSDSRR